MASRPVIKAKGATGEEHELEVIQILEGEPSVGQCELKRRISISQSSVCKIAKENKRYLHHVTLVQEL